MTTDTNIIMNTITNMSILITMNTATIITLIHTTMRLRVIFRI